MSLTPSQLPGPGNSRLSGVAVRSPCDAWAVGTISGGDSGPGQTLILHWDGTHWTQIPSPDPGRVDNSLFSVAATSATSAWAVGDFTGSTGEDQTLVEHWDGSTWTKTDSPAPGQTIDLSGVVGTSATNIWAVGLAGSASLQTLAEHYDGTGWTRSPSPGTGFLESVAATSPADAWAVGWDFDGNPVVLHYNGTDWARAPVRGPGALYDVAASSAASGWAVGGPIRSDQFGPIAVHLRCC